MSKKVLVIDDEENIVKAVKRLFHADPEITVDAILNASELEEVLAKSSYDLVLVDVMMPGVDGIEVVRRIQKGHRDREMRIVAFSGNYPDDAKMLLESMGVFKCIDKPLNPEVFVQTIKDILHGYLNNG